MFIIGLTGGICTGKSAVARLLRRKGACIIDADRLAREVVKPGQPALSEIVSFFGRAVLMPDGTLDRARLAELVFKDRQKLEKLNSIIHPRVGNRILELTRACEQKNPEAIIVYDIPLLIEAGMQDLVNLVLLVYASPDLQLARLQQRDRLGQSEAKERIAAQMPIDEKIKHADYIIDNSGSPADTAKQVERFWRDLVSPGNRVR